MFERFVRFLSGREVTLASFGEDHLAAFFEELAGRCAPGTNTRQRYVNLINRLCRELVRVGLRGSNPAENLAHWQAWGDHDAPPIMLDAEADARLQRYVQPQLDDGRTEARNRAIVAMLLATGITSAEIRVAKVAHLELERPRPYIAVVKAHSRSNRTVPLDTFGIVPLECWLQTRAAAGAGELLFPSPRTDGPMNDMFMLLVVRAALEAIGFEAADMGPRVLRATYASRQLLAGPTQQEVTALLGCRTLKTAQRVHMAIEAARRD